MISFNFTKQPSTNKNISCVHIYNKIYEITYTLIVSLLEAVHMEKS